MTPVLELPGRTEPVPWPLGERPAEGLLVLSERLTMPETGLAMAAWADANTADTHATGADRLREAVAAEATRAAGGLTLRDAATGAAVLPGCCCGLEDWRDWYEVCAGGSPWLGHDPSPWVEPDGPLIRVWPDDGTGQGPPVVLPRAELPALLDSVRRQLAGFLYRVDGWARVHVPRVAADLVAKLDRDLRVNAPAG